MRYHEWRRGARTLPCIAPASCSPCLPPAAPTDRRTIGTHLNTYDVTITWLAPASRYFFALAGVMPPPTCMPPGNADNADSAAASFTSPLPSRMTCPPRSSSFAYSLQMKWDEHLRLTVPRVQRARTHLAKYSGGCVATKFVVGASAAPATASFSVPPTICFTTPSWMSMHGLNFILAGARCRRTGIFEAA